MLVACGTPVANLPGARRYRISAGTGWLGVSILQLGEIESLMCKFSVWQHVQLSEQIRPEDVLALCVHIKQPTNDSGVLIMVITLSTCLTLVSVCDLDATHFYHCPASPPPQPPLSSPP